MAVLEKNQLINAAENAVKAALKLGAEEVEAYTYEGQATNIGIELGQISKTNRIIDRGLGVRIIMNKAIGFAYTNILDDKAAVDGAVARALSAAKASKPDHDWHFIPAAVTLKNGLGIPFIYTVESLEDHRSPTANSSYNIAIKSIEWLGFYEAHAANVKSEWMKEEIIRIYKVPPEKIAVIPENTDDWIKEVLQVYGSVSEAK